MISADAKVLLISIRPVFAQRIIEGRKTVELRRIKPQICPGHQVLIYGSSPLMALVGSAVIDRVETAAPAALWPRVKRAAAIAHSQYRDYFDNSSVAVGIWLREVWQFPQPVSLSELRQHIPGFQPPQSYRFVHPEDDRLRGYLPGGRRCGDAVLGELATSSRDPEFQFAGRLAGAILDLRSATYVRG